jgi:membrane-associated phospholipid phosphatase
MRLALPAPFRPRPRTTGWRAAVDSQPGRVAALLGTGALAGTAFGAVAVASARHATEATDHRIHDGMQERLDGPARDAAEAVAPAIDQAAKWWVYGPAAVVLAAAVLAAPGRTPRTRRGRRVGALAIAVVPALASALSPAFDRWLPQPPTGPRRRPVDHPVFPSGHAFRVTAVALAAAYVVVRERLAGAGRTWPLAAALPATVGVSRLVREKHLASDVVGGWLAGTALATVAAGAYELARTPVRGPRRRPRRG